MFKLENYITPLLLSYVDKYIKNFRPEDSQVSLWGGDASFHNLDLRLEVLEQELQLPFSFVSGHIHELLIHVPWTKLASEPITITINTIECILKLRCSENNGSQDISHQNKDRQRRSVGKRQDVEAPPGYVQSLINKIVSNIKIFCNNLILKYVEEDIVVSMNVKLLTFESANERWESAYIDISSPQVVLRKLITISDLTICLDKRNAAGKIDVYQEPVLYRCSLVMHMLRQYHSATANRASTTKLDIYCSSMEFGMTEQQVPMLMRVGMLLLALQQKQLRPDTDVPTEYIHTTADISDMLESSETWAGWAWSLVPSILPTSWDEDWNQEQEVSSDGHIVHIGFYVDYASLTFKVSETSNERGGGYYSQRKLKYLPLLTLRLQGIFVESVSHGTKWFHCSSGVSQAVLLPVGHCSCAHSEIPEGLVPAEYFKCGLISMAHKSDSLFDVEAAENKGQNRTYNTSWDFHMQTVTESSLLERTPAFASDFLYQLEIPDDVSSERLSEIGSDLEYSNLYERSLLRVVVGPLRLRLCSGFFHRISSLRVAASSYDYSPYSTPKPDPPLSDLPPPCAEDFDALSDNIPTRSVQFTIIAPSLVFQLMDHPYFEATKRNLYRKRKKLSANTTSPNVPTYPRMELPKVTIECQCIDAKFDSPMYINRLVQTVCQLPDPPPHMFNACHTTKTVKIIGIRSRLIVSPTKHTTIIIPSSCSFTSRSILKPQYWTHPDIPQDEVTFESENITISGTKPKLMVIAYILDKLIKMDGQDSQFFLINNTLLRDASRSFGMAYLELCVEGLRFKMVSTSSTTTVDASLGSIKAFIYEPIIQGPLMRDTPSSVTSINSATSKRLNTNLFSTRDIQQILFISGPELKEEIGKMDNEYDVPLVTVTIQFPLNPENQPHPPILIFNIQEIRICIDPLLCRWMLYKPRSAVKKTEFFDPQQRKVRQLSEASGSLLETPRRVGTPHESIHSSSDREHIFIPPPIQKIAKESETLELQEKAYNFLKKWFSVWKSMLLNGEMSQCTIYFPVGSLSAVGSQGIQQAVREALKKPDPPEIFVVVLPQTCIFSAAQRSGLSKYMLDIPIKLPQSVWTSHKSGFPWIITVTDMSCYTLQNCKKLNFLKPLSLNATIGVSTKSNGSNIKSTKPEATSTLEKDAATSTSFYQIRSSVKPIHAEKASIYYDTLKTDFGPLGICVHIDMSSIELSVSELQVCLIASILYGLTEVISSLVPEGSKEAPKSPEMAQPVLGWSSTVSPTLLRESTLDSMSEQTPPIATFAGKMESDSVKLTAWIQWTIARFKIQILSHDTTAEDGSYLFRPNLKLVIDAEDIVSSLDFQSVYLKVKCKVGSAIIQHFKRQSFKRDWESGPFLGLVMKSKEDVATGDRQEDVGFVTVTITRASCQHTHALWGTVHKRKLKDNKANTNNTMQFHTPARYITEIVITTQPIDVVISLTLLRSFFMVFEPLMNMSKMDLQESRTQGHWLFNLNNQSLPLLYVECQGTRIIMPSVELGGTGAEHDVCMFQVDTINLMPSAVNPICRTPCRPDIYQLAAQSRILHIPGSEVEDRQYQLDITGLAINSGTWEELDPILNTQSSNLSTLRTMSENPALEWNNLEQGRLNVTPHLSFWPIIIKFDLSVIIAPAMVYKTTLVCGHSIEINCVSDVDVNLSLSQIKLTSALLTEFVNIFKPFILDEDVIKRPKIMFPYPRFDPTPLDIEEEETESVDLGNRDSGIDTELLSIFSSRTKDSGEDTLQAELNKFITTKTGESDKSFGIFPRPPNPLPPGHHNIPIDLLITGGKVSLVLYQRNIIHGKVKLKQKDKKEKPILKENDYEKGYEASEEGSIDEKHNQGVQINRFQPLFFVSISQPNAFLSRFYLGRKLQLSCFDVRVKISGPEYVPLKAIPTIDDFPIDLLETKPGMPNPDTGILPAFFTLKWARGIGKPASVDIDIARPTRILCSVTRWNYLIIIKNKVIDSCRSSFESINNDLRVTSFSKSDTNTEQYGAYKITENYTKFKEIKRKLYHISNLNVNLAQIVLAMKTDNVPEVNLSISKLKNTLTISNRPERLTNIITLESLTVGMLKDGVTKLLVNPWSISLETSLFWESWQSPDSNPQVQISIESDCIMLDVSPEQINCVEMVVKDLTDFFTSLPYEDSPSEAPSFYEGGLKYTIDREQYYKDDLRAGAFQFVDATSHNVNELPLPYQVMFWNKKISAMAWRYPQPRALTKVRIFPVPFKVTSDNYNEDYQVLCHLEYWSECHGCYRPYVQFYLSESEVCHLELPENNIQSVACVWRVVLSTDINQSLDFEHTRFFISPRALAACMRIDSYFNKALVPDLILSLEISTINISLYNNFNKSQPVIMPEALKSYTCDMNLSDNHCFASLTLDGTRAYLATWKFEAAAFDITTTIKCSVLDYAFLTQQTLLEPFSAKFDFTLAKNMGVSFISKPIDFKFSPSTAHTLAVSLQMWEQRLKNKNVNELTDLIIMTRYVVCNDTNINLRFGQTTTDEDILLPPRYCHLYCWRSQKSKQMIRVGLEENGWIWSQPFQIDLEGTDIQQINISNNLSLVVCIQNLSATQKQITFAGHLIICNMLLEHFELKVVPVVKDDKDKVFKKAPSQIIPGKSTPPSLLIDNNEKYHLRLRFFGLESAWSGDIPLMENTKCAQPWLVKVPLQERGQFLSIWCRIISQQFGTGTQTLAMLWPLFMVRSNLPVSTKVHIETPTLNVHLESTVRGKGEYQQLYCPGTIDHSHQLSFQLEGGSTTSNPYVPLNYSLVDQKEFFKRSENESISETLKILKAFEKPTWPYFGEDYEGIEWVAEDQPLTHVQVRYQNVCPSSSALLVELLPWSLLINVLGCPVAVIVNEKELFRICHHGIVTPPKLEDTFHIGVGINGTWNVSLPLQLTTSEWSSHSFYMPRITGSIPLEGNIQTAIKCNKHICMVSITSNLENEIRLLKICSTHVLTNHMSMQIQVVCFAIAETELICNMPKNIEKHSFAIAPRLDQSNAGISILQWYLIGDNDVDLNSTFALYISLSLNSKFGWTCPVRVDKDINRRGITLQSENENIPIVFIGHQHKGQTFLSLHNDLYPQIRIENKSGTKLFFAQSCVDDDGENTIVKDCQHFTWVFNVENGGTGYYTMSGYSEKFPDLSPNNFIETLVVASDPQDDPRGYQWSTPVNIASYNDQFIRIPFFGDVKITIVNSLHTTFITIDSASQVEISARDIRIRLFMHENHSSLESIKTATTDIRKEFVNVNAIATNSSSDTTVTSTTYFSAEDVRGPTVSLSESSILTTSTGTTAFGLQTVSNNTGAAYGIRTLPTLLEQSTGNLHGSRTLRRCHSEAHTTGGVPDVNISNTLLTRTMPMRKDWTAFKITAFIKSVNLTLFSDLNSESTEIAHLSCDDVVITAVQTEVMQVSLSISEMQLDNQMYTQGTFDFPVVLIGEVVNSKQELSSLNTPIMHWITNAQKNPIVKIDLIIETWKDSGRHGNITGIRDVKINIQSLSTYIEDIYVTLLMDYLACFSPTKLVLWPRRSRKINYSLNSILVGIPDHILWESVILARPLTLQSLTIEPLSLLLSVHSSLKMYIALDQSPLQFGKFERKRVLTTSYRLGHALTMHYLSGAIFGAGWVVGSLELLGSPGGLARAMGSGLRDFVSLPYNGLVQGPWAFLSGITYGSASLMRHITAGTLQSVTKLASSVARNLDRLTLDEEHLRRTEEQRRMRPQGLAQGFLQGLTGLGISLLGAVGGIAHHPIQSVMMDGASPRGLAAGVGLGLVGVITKPLSGTADLIALTGQGLLQGAGWNKLPEPRIRPTMHHIYSNPNAILKYNWKFMQSLTQSSLLFVTDATWITNDGQYEGVALVLTTDALIIINTDEDVPQRVLSLTELNSFESDTDPTLLSFKLIPPLTLPKSQDECMVEMDPACRARVADYVRTTVGLLKFPDDLTPDPSEMSVSPCPTPSSSTETIKEQAALTFYVNPQRRNYFLTVLSLAKHQHQNYSFPVL